MVTKLEGVLALLAGKLKKGLYFVAASLKYKDEKNTQHMSCQTIYKQGLMS